MLSRVKASQALSASSNKPTRRVVPSYLESGSTSYPKAPSSFQSRKKRKLGSRVIKEIKRLQASTDLLIPKLPFARVVREICKEFKDINK